MICNAVTSDVNIMILGDFIATINSIKYDIKLPLDRQLLANMD